MCDHVCMIARRKNSFVVSLGVTRQKSKNIKNLDYNFSGLTSRHNS